MGQHKRKPKDGLRPLTRRERLHAQRCFHEASHAVVLMMVGLRVDYITIAPTEPSLSNSLYREWFNKYILPTTACSSIEEFAEGGFLVFGGAISHKVKYYNLSREHLEAFGLVKSIGLAAPAITETRAPWTNKSTIPEETYADKMMVASFLQEFPNYKETDVNRLVEHLLTFKHVSQSIETIGKKAEEVKFLDEEALLTLCLTETERTVNLAREADDFFIESVAKPGDLDKFERAKAEVLEMGLGLSKTLLQLLHNSPNSVIDMDLITRHDKWTNEYAELMDKNGPTIVFNLGGR